MNLKVGDYVRTMNTKNTFDKEGEKYSKTVYIIDSIVGNKYSIKNTKTDNTLQKKYGINELLKIDNDFESFETKNDEEKEKVVKEHKTDKIITKEGLSKDNVIEGRPKRSAFNTEKMKEVYKILRRR